MISIQKNDYYLKISYVNDTKEYSGINADIERDYYDEVFKRAKRQVLDYGYNNVWTHFITLTIDNKKADITNPNKLIKCILRQFNNYQQRYDNDFKYILIPELGSKTGRLHFHGLVYLVNTERLKFMFMDKDFGVPVYRDDWFYKNIGANQFTKINYQSPAIIRYITKYMQKNTVRIFDRCYYCSKGLKKSMYLIKSVKNDTLESDFYYQFLYDQYAHNTPYATSYELDISNYDKIIKWLDERGVEYEI